MMKKILIFLALSLSFAFAQLPDLEGRVLNIGSDTTYPPMETINPDTGEVEGFDVDLMAALCDLLNCEANFVTTAWDGIFAALAQGEFDMVVSGVSITEERDMIVDFSDPYIIVSQAILMRVEDEGITLEDYQTGVYRLAAQIGTTNATLAEDLVGRDRVNLFDNFGAAVLALQNGDVDGVVIDGTSAGAYEQQFAGELTVGIKGLQADPLGLVFQEGDELVDAFNAGIAALQEDGTLEALTNKYFNSGE
ncbi:MAG: transporter substrate-binding domain-containing protein [Deinococcales bacterium]